MARVRIKEPIGEQSTPVSHTPETHTAQTIHHTPKRKPLWIMMAVVFALGLLIFLINDRNKLRQQLDQQQTSSQTASSNEAEQLKKEIGQFFELPADETPTILNVSDVDSVKARDPVFFEKAQTGDKVVLFAKAGLGILYRPSTKKIINAAHIANPSSAPSTGTSSPSGP